MIEIRRSPTADTVSRDELLQSSTKHIDDVRAALAFFVQMLGNAARIHDFDKVADIESFHADFLTGFEQHDWWDRHKKINRHHLSEPDGVPADVNLIDVLEYIADCVMSGMARAGRVRPVEIDSDVLWLAFKHTAEMLEREVEVVG